MRWRGMMVKNDNDKIQIFKLFDNINSLFFQLTYSNYLYFSCFYIINDR